MKRIVICSGGTGGHVFPAVALLQKLYRKKSNHSLYFYTDKRSFKWLDCLPSSVQKKTVLSGQFYGKNVSKKLLSLIVMGMGAGKVFLDFKPDILILNLDSRYFSPILNMYPKEKN